MNNTITEGMLGGSGLEIIGGRKEGWDNPDSTARNGLGQRDYGLSIQEIVDNVLKKPAFGFEGYNPKAKVKDLLPVNTHVRAKAKRNTFCDEAIKMKDKVPSSDRYFSMLDWKKNPTSRNYRFGKDGRNMIAEEIIHKSKNPAKTSPGPAGYDHYDGWKYTNASPHGTAKIKEKRITFV